MGLNPIVPKATVKRPDYYGGFSLTQESFTKYLKISENEMLLNQTQPTTII